MSRKDKLQNEFSLLKFWLGIVVGVALAIIGWIVTSFEALSALLLLLSAMTVALLAIIALAISLAIAKNLKEIEKED